MFFIDALVEAAKQKLAGLARDRFMYNAGQAYRAPDPEPPAEPNLAGWAIATPAGEDLSYHVAPTLSTLMEILHFEGSPRDFYRFARELEADTGNRLVRLQTLEYPDYQTWQAVGSYRGLGPFSVRQEIAVFYGDANNDISVQFGTIAHEDSRSFVLQGNTGKRYWFGKSHVFTYKLIAPRYESP